jgi:hypothetical protein
MARMIDALKAGALDTPDGVRFTKDPVKVFAHILDAEPITADEVFRYALEVQPTRIPWHEIPCLAPPYEHFWLEARAPAFYRGEDGQLIPVKSRLRQWKASGYYAQCVSVGWWLEDVARIAARDRAMAAEMFAIVDDDVERKWVYSVSMFTQDHNDRVFGPIASLWLGIDGQGRAPFGKKFLLQEYASRSDPIRIDGEGISSLFDPFWLAVSMFHVRNVRLVPSEPISPKLAKARAKRGKPPITATTTVVVDPVRETLRRIDDARKRGEKIDLAIHHVRAHYKTFTADRPLFGKVTGRFFWPVTLRGSREHGERKHVYEVEPPRSA